MLPLCVAIRRCAASRRARLGCVGAELLGDQRESRPFGSTTKFDGRADHASGVGDEIREDEQAASRQRLLGLHRAWNVGTLDDEPALRSREVVGMDDIRPRRGDPDIAWDVHARVHRELAAARMIVQCLPFGL